MAIAVGDSDPAIRQFMTSGGYSFPLMLDPGDAGTAYEISVIPTVVLIDASGAVAKSVTGIVSAEELAGMVEDLGGR